jgi:hypothetical protein
MIEASRIAGLWIFAFGEGLMRKEQQDDNVTIIREKK